MSDARWNITDIELDDKGRVLGTGPDRIVSWSNMALFILNYLILSIFMGLGLSHFLLKSPLANLVGRLLGFVVVQVMRILSVSWWFVTGHLAPLTYFKNSPTFGTPEIKGISFIGLILLIALIIGIRSYRKSYVSFDMNQYILIGNSASFIIFTAFLIAY